MFTPRIRQKPGAGARQRRLAINFIRAQATIEFTLGVVVLFMFLLAAMKLFVWFNRSMVERQENFEYTRSLAGDPLVMRTQIPQIKSIYEYVEESVQWDKVLAKNFVVNRFYSRNITKELVGWVKDQKILTKAIADPGFPTDGTPKDKWDFVVNYFANYFDTQLPQEIRNKIASGADWLEIAELAVGSYFTQQYINNRWIENGNAGLTGKTLNNALPFRAFDVEGN